MKQAIIYLLFFSFIISCRNKQTYSQQGIIHDTIYISDTSVKKSKDPLQDIKDRSHYFSTTKEEYEYVVNPNGLLRFTKGTEKIKAGYSLESIGIDGYTNNGSDIDLGYLMRWEGNKIYPCAMVVAFIEKDKAVNFKCIPTEQIDDDKLAERSKKDFESIDKKWMPNLIQLLLSLGNNYMIKTLIN